RQRWRPREGGGPAKAGTSPIPPAVKAYRQSLFLKRAEQSLFPTVTMKRHTNSRR
ncbi:hypothetical protein Dimus_004169, partial [Dionaea muscipula]